MMAVVITESFIKGIYVYILGENGKMNAQQIIKEADTQRFNPRQFRKEMNISWLINDVVKKCKELEE